MFWGASVAEHRRFAAEVFAVACAHVFSDGQVEPGENRMLRELARVLGLPAGQALDIARAARDGRVAGRAGDAEAGAVMRDIAVLVRGRLGDGAAEERWLGEIAAALEVAPDRALPAEVGVPALEGEDDEPRADGWLKWPARLWARPWYTIARVVDGGSPYRRARAIRRRIAKLARRAPSAELLGSVVARVTAAAETLWDIADELDQLTAYLSARGALPAPPRRRVGEATPIEAMRERRAQLGSAVTRMLGELERLEDRVAAYALARPDGLPRRLEGELEQALTELEIVVSVVR